MSTNKTIDELSAGVPITDTDKFAVWQGAGPTASVNGANIKTYIGAAILDTSTAGQVALVDGANALTSDAGLTYDSGTTSLTAGAFKWNGDSAQIEIDGTARVTLNGHFIGSGAILGLDATGGAGFGETIFVFDSHTYTLSEAGDFGTALSPLRTGYFGTSVVTPVIECTPVPLAELGSAVGVYKKAMISDGLTLGTWGSAAVDGGVVVKPVWSNGVAWLNG